MFQRYLIVVVEEVVGGFLDLPHLGSTTEPWLFYFAPPHLCFSLSFFCSYRMCKCKKKKKKSLFNQRHLSLAPCFLVKTTQRAREPTHREHIYPGKGPVHCIPMDLHGERTAEHILYVNNQNWMWHIPSFFPLSSFLLFFSHVSSQSLRSASCVLTEHVGHGGQHRSKKPKQKKTLGFWFVLHQKF